MISLEDEKGAMRKDITRVLSCLAIVVIVMCILSTSILVLNNRIATGRGNSGFNQKVSALQADQEVRFNGTAVEYFSSTGSSGWNVQVEEVSSGPSEIKSHTVTVALWSAAGVPSGTIDPEIEPGDRVAVYGLYMDDDYVTLSESEQYHITKIAAENQPSVSVGYPNGGESITIGTPVEVSADASDDKAVTSVTFYYSRDGGSNWTLIGEGVKVSGTDKDGKWNRTWDTSELSAGSNYSIKSVASDGTSTSEDQSESAFSLTPSKVIRVPDDYPTIQAAIDAASSGYIITVPSGTYFELLVIDKPLKLVGEDKNTTIINGSRSGYCVHVTADNVEISGFRIENGGCGVYLKSSIGSIIDNNIISDHCEGIALRDSNNNVIINNILFDNSCSISGIHLSSSHNNVIRDNDLIENGGGVSLYDSNNNLIYHNNFVDNIFKQAYGNRSTNSWDNGPIDGGNYWSDHGCIGNPSAEPYSIDSDGVDHYPFQDQNGWLKGNQPPSSPTLNDPGTTEYTPGTYLLKTTWDRHGLYALKTPLKDPFGDPNDPDNHWSLGSWSTAIGQIINFHHLQSFGTVHYVCSEIVDAGGKKVVIDNDLNKHIYNWGNMPSRLSATSSSEEIDSVSTFIYDVATVIQRDFGTGTYPLTHSKRANALVDHFDNLDSATEIILNPPIADIEKEVSDGHPCMLHLRTKQKKYFAVVIDGYKWQNGEFRVHLNFGKGGTSDGWYDYNQEIDKYDDNAYRKVFFIRLSGDERG